MGFLITALVLVFIFRLRVSVRIRAGDETKLSAGLGFISINLFPMKEKKIKLKKFEIEKYRKWQSKRSVRKPKKRKKTKTKDNEAAKNEELATDVLALIGKFSRIIKVMVKWFGNRLRIDAKEIILIIATGDAAKTAVMYGAAVGLFQNLYALLVSNNNLHPGRESRFYVEPDFTADKSTVRIDVKFSFRLWHLVEAGVLALREYLRNDSEAVV